jgi:hypothetical protein
MAAVRGFLLSNDENSSAQPVQKRVTTQRGLGGHGVRKALGNITNTSSEQGGNALKDISCTKESSKPLPPGRASIQPVTAPAAENSVRQLEEALEPVERYQGLPAADQRLLADAVENLEISSLLRWMSTVKPVAVLAVRAPGVQLTCHILTDLCYLCRMGTRTVKTTVS